MIKRVVYSLDKIGFSHCFNRNQSNSRNDLFRYCSSGLNTIFPVPTHHSISAIGYNCYLCSLLEKFMSNEDKVLLLQKAKDILMNR